LSFCNSENECGIRADLRTLYVGPALGPLTRAAHQLYGRNKMGALQKLYRKYIEKKNSSSVIKK